MSVYRDWEFYGKNKSGSFLSSKQIECLVALDEFDLENMEFYEDDTLFASGCTTSAFAYEHIQEAVEKYAEIYPEVILTVIVSDDCGKCGFMLRDGKVQEFESCTVYVDEEGRELDPMDGL